MPLEVSTLPDLASFRRSMAGLRSLPDRVVRSAIRRGLRQWGAKVAKSARSAAPRASGPYRRYPDSAGRKRASVVLHEPGGLLRRGITVRARTYRSGVLWLGIGVRRSFDYSAAGWRSHFAERGFLNRKLGRTFAGRRFLAQSLAAHRGDLRPSVVRALDAAIRGASR